MNRSEIQSPDQGHSDGPIRFGPFELDPARFELRRSGDLVPVEPRTFDLLQLLARNISYTVTWDEIVAALSKPGGSG